MVLAVPGNVANHAIRDLAGYHGAHEVLMKRQAAVNASATSTMSTSANNDAAISTLLAAYNSVDPAAASANSAALESASAQVSSQSASQSAYNAKLSASRLSASAASANALPASASAGNGTGIDTGPGLVEPPVDSGSGPSTITSTITNTPKETHIRTTAVRPVSTALNSTASALSANSTSTTANSTSTTGAGYQSATVKFTVMGLLGLAAAFGAAA